MPYSASYYLRIFFLLIIGFIGMQFYNSCRSSRIERTDGSLKEFHLNHMGIDRSYLLYFPGNKNNARSLPVLFCLHGGGGTAQGMIKLTFGRFNDLADKEGFIVIYPQGIDKGWNDGRKGDFSTAIVESIDDTGFFIKIIDNIKSKYQIDTTRIFTCGISNGGFMSARLACDLSNLISGAAIITATLGIDYLPLCKPSRPIRMIIMNGTSDPLVPYPGGDIRVFRKKRGTIVSTDEFVKFWALHNGCNPIPVKENLTDKDPRDGTRVERFLYTPSDRGSEVLFYKIINGGHTWPGGKQYLNEGIIGKTCRDINACDEIVKFFLE